MKPEHRARLVELAAARGEKGFSGLIAEALDAYLEAQRKREKDINAALALRGSIRKADADAMRAEIRRIRRVWR